VAHDGPAAHDVGQGTRRRPGDPDGLRRHGWMLAHGVTVTFRWRGPPVVWYTRFRGAQVWLIRLSAGCPTMPWQPAGYPYRPS
jgi:hypothetical protein